jgi:integrase
MSWNPDKPELGENLYKVKGQWRLRFTGEQLKVSRRGGKINAIEYKFPLDLTEALERYLYTWRPLVVAAGTNRHLAPAEHNQFSKNTDQEIVFLTTVGKPFIKDQICMLIQKMTLKYAGVPVNPHMLRTIWATEYIMDNKDPVVAAYMLNDSVKTVMDKYAMLLRPSSADAASEWVTKNLAD